MEDFAEGSVGPAPAGPFLDQPNETNQGGALSQAPNMQGHFSVVWRITLGDSLELRNYSRRAHLFLRGL